MNLFNVGALEIMVIVVLAFILFGPQKLLGLVASLRKAFTEFQRNVSDVASAAMEQHEASEAEAAPDDRAEFVRESPSRQEKPSRLNELRGEDEG